MSLELKAKVDWQPTASKHQLQQRAKLLQQLRLFFAERGVLEVETPLLCQHTVTGVHTPSFVVATRDSPQARENWGGDSPGQSARYLQTSPEYAMKRLLAAGSGCIYQISKAFRCDESGRWHNPEFTMLEWYRLGYDHYQLMTEIEDLLRQVTSLPKPQRISYQQLFQQRLSLDIFQCALADLQRCCRQHQLHIEQPEQLGFDDYLQLLLSHVLEPQLGQDAPLFIYDFPSTQAALAKICPFNPRIARRFELYINGVEIANGFDELTDPQEQAARFEQDQALRSQWGLPVPALDAYLLAALEHGLPDCAGVALGVDRLLMALTQSGSIEDILSFPWERA